MKLKKCDEMIEGLEIKQLKVIKDERGFLMEILRSDDKFFEKFIAALHSKEAKEFIEKLKLEDKITEKEPSQKIATSNF